MESTKKLKDLHFREKGEIVFKFKVDQFDVAEPLKAHIKEQKSSLPSVCYYRPGNFGMNVTIRHEESVLFKGMVDNMSTVDKLLDHYETKRNMRE